MPILVAAMDAVTLAALIATPLPQAAEGRYNVIGQSDGKLYKDIPNSGKPKTGMYTKPTLVAESGREIVIDSPTTENLMMNYPNVIQAIRYAAGGFVPQHATGNYPFAGGYSPSQVPIIQNDPRNTSAIEKLNNHLDKGLIANVIFDDVRRATDKIDTIESLASTSNK
jgi:hypothetical protein